MTALEHFTALAWVASHPWLYPALEAVHLVGIGLLVGSLALVELRLWGLGASLPLPALARLGLGLTLTGFGIAAASGTVLFLSQAAELLGNRAFLGKLVLLAAAGGNALVFHLRDGLGRADAIARLQSLLSMGLWLGVIMCGRWIAYV